MIQSLYSSSMTFLREIIMPNILQLRKEGILAGTFQPGDIIQFHNTQNIGKLATFLQSRLFNISARKYRKHSHSAVVVGVTLDGMPIISHMCFNGVNIQRMDASKFCNYNFTLLRTSDNAIAEKIAQAARREHNDNKQQGVPLYNNSLTNILKQTDKRFIENFKTLKQECNTNSESYDKAKSYFKNLGLLGNETNPKYPHALINQADNRNQSPRFSIKNAFKAAFKHNERKGHIEKYKNELDLKDKLDKKLNQDQTCSQFAMNSIKNGLIDQFQIDQYQDIANASAKIVPALLTEKIIQSGFILQKMISIKQSQKNIEKLSSLVKNKEISAATHVESIKLIETQPKSVDLNKDAAIKISVLDLLALMRGKKLAEEINAIELESADLILLKLMLDLYPLYENILCLAEKNLITPDTRNHYFNLIHQVSKPEEHQNWKTNKIIISHYTDETHKMLLQDKAFTPQYVLQSSRALENKLLGYRPPSKVVTAIVCGIIGGFLGFGFHLANALLRFRFGTLANTFSAFSRGFVVGSSMVLGDHAIHPASIGHTLFSCNKKQASHPNECIEMDSKLKAKEISDDLVKIRTP